MLYFPFFVEEEIIPSEKVKTEVESFQHVIKLLHRPQKIIINGGDRDLIKLLLLKYVYYKIIIGDNARAEKLLLVTTDNFINAKFNIEADVIDLHIITDNIIDNDDNFLIPDRDLEKCWWILGLFEDLKKNYSSTSGFPSGVSEIQNYDKFVTRKFFNNITKISTINITESCEYCARFVPIIPPVKRCFKHKFGKKRLIENFCQPNNIISDSDIIIDWLFKNCEHVETFEIGLFAATSQALYVTEGFDAFKKFLVYAESLDDNDRIKLVNILIKLFNNFSRNDNYGDNYLCVIPKIITALNLCDQFLQYPESVAESVFNAATMDPIFEDFIIKSRTNWWAFHEGIKNLGNNSKNIVRKQFFGRERTTPMQAIINEHDKLIAKI